jgi:hypothetical protein
MKMGKICVFSKYSEDGEAGVGYDVPPTIRHNIYIHSWVKNSSLITVARWPIFWPHNSHQALRKNNSRLVEFAALKVPKFL